MPVEAVTAVQITSDASGIFRLGDVAAAYQAAIAQGFTDHDALSITNNPNGSVTVGLTRITQLA